MNFSSGISKYFGQVLADNIILMPNSSFKGATFLTWLIFFSSVKLVFLYAYTLDIGRKTKITNTPFLNNEFSKRR